METALVRFGHKFQDSKTDKAARTPKDYKRPTCEDIFSSSERDMAEVEPPRRLDHIAEEVDGSIEPQQRATAGGSSLPKQSNVTWSGDPVHTRSQRSSAHRWSDETISAPFGSEDYARRVNQSNPFDTKPTIHINVGGSSRPTRRPERSDERRSRYLDDSGSESNSGDDGWYRRRAGRHAAARRPSSPPLYMQHTTGDYRTRIWPREQRGDPWAAHDRGSEPLHPYPVYPRDRRDDIPPAPMQPWYDSYLNLYEDDHPHPWQHVRHASPPRPQAAVVPPPDKGSDSPRLARIEALLTAQQNLLAQTIGEQAAVDDAAEIQRHSTLTTKYRDLIRELEQAVNREKKAPRKSKDEAKIKNNPALSSPPSSAVETEGLTSLSDLELVKLMDERMQTLKQKNEERLIEANQVLAYLERRSENIHQQPTVGAEPNRLANSADENAQVPIVYAFRTPDEESKVYDDESDDTDVDSIVGNSSGSSVSSLVSRAHRARLSRNKIEGRHGRRTGTGLVERVVDESVNRVYSGSESVIGGGGLSHNLPERTEHGNDGGPNDEPVNHTPEARTEHDMVGEVIALRRDLSILKRQIVRKNKSWLGQTLCSTYARWKTQLREVPRPGTQRLEWTCECGDEMFADLPVENGAQYQQMLEFLTRPAPKTQPTSQNRTTPSQLEGGTAQLNYTSLQLSQSSIGQSNAPASTVGSGNTYVGSGNSQAPTAQQNGLYVRNKYLELCVDVGKYETKLAEIQVASSESNGAAICTDAHLFRQIYHRYFALRKHTWRRFLYRPAGIKFVHFGVQAGYRVSFFSSDPLPSEEIIASKQYEYNLQPPVPPPMDSRTFLHYFYKHNAHSQSTSAKYVSRLPKKLGDSLTRSLGVDELLEGWGIHIIEGPNKVAICWALMVVLVASFGVSIGYDLITQSGDSGFAIGQWMVAALTVGLSALYFSLEDDVSSNFD